MSQKQWIPLTTAELAIAAINAGWYVEFTACGCDYQAQNAGWVEAMYRGLDDPAGVMREGGKYRALIAPAQPHSCANCLGVDPESCMFAPAQPAAAVDPADADLAAAIAKGVMAAWPDGADGYVDELRGGAVEPVLSEDDVQWIVNDNSELGVMIRGQAFFLYKGNSLVYEDARHDDGRPMYYRSVGKREFGECCYPVNQKASIKDSDRWQILPAATVKKEEPTND